MIRQTVLLMCVAIGLSSTTGCSMLSSKRKIKQLESESERLLSEYRYERERADRLDDHNRALNERVSDLQRRLAQATGGDSRRIFADRDSLPIPPGDQWRSTRR